MSSATTTTRLASESGPSNPTSSSAPRLQLHLKGSAMGARTEPTQLPSYSSPQEEQRHAKEKLAAAYRIFHKLGFDEAVAGHITLRDPINPDAFWLASFGIPFDQVCVSDLLLIDHYGNVLKGGKPGDGQMFNAAGFAIHSALHAARGDINAAAHAHSRYGKAFSALGRNLDIANYDSAAFAHTIKHYDDFGGVVLADEEAKRICTAMSSDGQAIILQNHGLLSVGKTVEAAVAYYVRLEQLCQSQLMADMAGVPVEMDTEDVEDVFRKYGGEEEAWFQAQALFEAIERECGEEYKQ